MAIYASSTPAPARPLLGSAAPTGLLPGARLAAVLDDVAANFAATCPDGSKLMQLTTCPLHSLPLSGLHQAAPDVFLFKGGRDAR